LVEISDLARKRSSLEVKKALHLWCASNILVRDFNVMEVFQPIFPTRWTSKADRTRIIGCRILWGTVAVLSGLNFLMTLDVRFCWSQFNFRAHTEKSEASEIWNGQTRTDYILEARGCVSSMKFNLPVYFSIPSMFASRDIFLSRLGITAVCKTNDTY
jgi:hypothetical protein